MSELKACPFCGGEAKLKHIGNEHCKKMMTEITCQTVGCFATQRVATLHNRHSFDWCDEKCIEHWNTRPAPERHNELREDAVALREQLKQLLLWMNSDQENEIEFYTKAHTVYEKTAYLAALAEQAAPERHNELREALVAAHEALQWVFTCQSYVRIHGTGIQPVAKKGNPQIVKVQLGEVREILLSFGPKLQPVLAQVEAALAEQAAPVKPEACSHEWVSADNQVVKGTLICAKCYALSSVSAAPVKEGV